MNKALNNPSFAVHKIKRFQVKKTSKVSIRYSLFSGTVQSLPLTCYRSRLVPLALTSYTCEGPINSEQYIKVLEQHMHPSNRFSGNALHISAGKC